MTVAAHDDLVTALGLATQEDVRGMEGVLARAVTPENRGATTIPEPLLGARQLPPSRLAEQPGHPRVGAMTRLGQPIW